MVRCRTNHSKLNITSILLFFIMKSKYQKLIGYGLFVGGLLWFFPFLYMVIPASLVNPDILENIFITLHVFFFTTWWMFHIPAYILIISGILLIKSEKIKGFFSN